MFSSKASRRDFVARVVAIAGAAALVPRPAMADARPAPGDEPEAWLSALRGTHRQLFHAHDKWTKGIEYAKRYKEAYPKEYGVNPSEVDSVLAAHGKTGATTYVDAAWEKYGFGKFFDVKESPKSDNFANRNIYYAGTDEDPGIREALAAGVVVLSCRTALRGMAAGFADQKKFGTAEEIERDLTASLIPGVILVPAMVIAIGRAQEQHCAYLYTG
ncbi:MAG: hypothetical protein M3R65_04015 [Gemmatimonadota bacterium]|nr:hypothetical protein [Gemmatimonadota bacterium]